MRTRQAQQLISDVYVLLDEVTASSNGVSSGVKPVSSDCLEWLNQEWSDLYDQLIENDIEWNLQSTLFSTNTNQDSYGFVDGAVWGQVFSVVPNGSGGAGYTPGTTPLIFSGQGGIPGFVSPVGFATVGAGGNVTSCTITNPGVGLTQTPAAAITGTGGGAGFTVAMVGCHYKTQDVDVQVSGGAQPLQWFPAHRFQREQRNQYNPSAWSWPQRIMYAVSGGTLDPTGADGTILKFVPPPPGGFTIRHNWYPNPQRMVNLTDVIDGVNGAERYMIYGAAQLAAMQSENYELADRLAQLKAERWTRIVSTLRDRHIGEAPMARVVRGRPSTGFGRVGRWWGGGG